ncbi:21215_t:CDS:2, partial [Gigaspora margarita]
QDDNSDNSFVDYLTNDTFKLSDNSSLHYVFSTMDGSYGFITTELSYDYSFPNESIPIISVYCMFLTPLTHQISEKFLLHYARNVSEISYISCSTSYSELGNVCLITELVEKFQDSAFFITYKIDFLSSGSIVGINAQFSQFIYTNSSTQFDIQPLFYGGAVVTSWNVYKHNNNKRAIFRPVSSTADLNVQRFTNITTNIISNNGSKIKWSFGNILDLATDVQFIITNNNTHILYVVKGRLFWDIYVSNIPKFRNDCKYYSGYENPNVISTYPTINNNTILPYISSISITFSNPISKSLNNITIYQTDTITKQFKPRKIFPGNSNDCEILNNILKCNVSSSIFNQWNSSYMITMDVNFVKFATTNEPIYGIEENKRIFKTVS